MNDDEDTEIQNWGNRGQFFSCGAGWCGEELEEGTEDNTTTTLDTACNMQQRLS